MLVAVAAHNQSEQRALQSQLANPFSTNYQAVASAATQLINGKRSGKFTFSNQLLAQYYLQGASAYYNMKQYPKAVTYYTDAGKYDSADRKAALQGEVSAGYAAGQRQQLIPLLKQLAEMSKNDRHDLTSPSSARYQLDIQAIQENQPVDL